MGINALNRFIHIDEYPSVEHQDKVQNLIMKTVINVFYNNKQKIAAGSCRKDDVKAFKLRKFDSLKFL